MPAVDSSYRLTLRCPRCQARLRAARELIGRDCPCPRCGTRVVVQPRMPSDSDILLVPLKT